MGQKVRYYGDRATFPAGACVHCLSPATQEIELARVKTRLSGGYVVRKVGVPFCDACVTVREARTPRQVLFERVGVAQSLVLALVVAVYVYLSTATVESGVWSAAGNESWRVILGLIRVRRLPPWAEVSTMNKRKGTPTWTAARPTPRSRTIVSNMSATRLRT